MDCDPYNDPFPGSRRLPEGHLAVRAGGRRDRSSRRSSRTCSPRATARSSRATSAGTSLDVPSGDRFAWADDSTYVRKPPYFEGMPAEPEPLEDIEGARVLAKLGDSVTTDHISPAGAIKKDSPAGQVPAGARRRAARLQLLRLAARQPRGDDPRHVREHPPAQPARAGHRGRRHAPPAATASEMSIYDAAMKYAEEDTPLVVLGGKEYGSGSSRDWAAKGTKLLGVRAVIAESFERIHRSNLVGMGVLPLQVEDATTSTGEEEISITGFAEPLNDGELPREVTVKADDKEFTARVRIDTPKEAEYFRHGGILPVRPAPAARRARSGAPRHAAQPADRVRPVRARARGRRRLAGGGARVHRRRHAATSSARRSPACPAPPAARALAVVGPHRRDRPDRHPRRRRGLPVVRRRRRLGPDDPRRPAGRARTRARATMPGVVGKKPIHLLESDEREKAPKLKDLHIDIGAEGRRRGARARARRRRRGHRRRAGRARRRPLRVALDGQPARRAGSRSRPRGSSPRPAARRATSSPCAVAAGGDDVRRRDDDARSRSSPTSRSSSTSRTRPTRRASTSARRATTALGDGAVIDARHGRPPARLRPAASTPPRPRASPSPVEAAARGDVHRRRRRSTSAARGVPTGLVGDPAALHALAGRGHAALRRRGVRAAHRGVRAAAVGRTRRSCGDDRRAPPRPRSSGGRRRGAGLAARAVLRPRLRLRADAGHGVHGRRPDVRRARPRAADPRDPVVGVERLRVADEHRRPRARAAAHRHVRRDGRDARRRARDARARSATTACCGACAYFVVRMLHAALFWVAARGDAALRRQVVSLVALGDPRRRADHPRLGARSTARRATCCGSPRVLLDYGIVLALGVEGWHVHAEHFAERFGLVVIIALGESIVAIGVGAEDLELERRARSSPRGARAGDRLHAVVGVLRRRTRSSPSGSSARRAGVEQLRIARDSYALLHLPMIAGIVLFALGVQEGARAPRRPAEGHAGGRAVRRPGALRARRTSRSGCATSGRVAGADRRDGGCVPRADPGRDRGAGAR